jgi:cytosine/creatinine deaminase
LQAAGVRVVAASDNVRDPFNPFGDYNLLHIANLCAHTAHLSGVDELRQAIEMVGALPAAAFYGVERLVAAGEPADLAVVDATSADDVITTLPRCTMTIKAGRIVFDHTSLEP